MLDCTSARSLSVTPFSDLTESLRASTVNRTAGVVPSAAMVPPAIGSLTQCSWAAAESRPAFPTLIVRELGVDRLFWLIGTGEDDERRGQVGNEHPGDANHKSAPLSWSRIRDKGSMGYPSRPVFPKM
jgi:hypothetical protein